MKSGSATSAIAAIGLWLRGELDGFYSLKQIMVEAESSVHGVGSAAWVVRGHSRLTSSYHD